MNKNEELGGWADFNDSDFLSPERVRDNKHAFAVVDVEKETHENHTKLILILETDKGTLKRKFSLNKTNGRFLEAAGIKSPKDAIGKVIYFEKIKVTNPTTKQIVDSLLIHKAE